ncbi:GNAT family N-acetyltransferase [Mycobacterium branderi]|uniref:GCN5-like N-acetyltransferase n=1 Tax=Mycobacterium branderi TaxID=43348 RepID=A0A7I7W281_9MYCO|nr:GNAT family N-acetyltransferase [Mycobacterium branderi]MCV7232003.1 GNAT family N-acetyltransferase [Mycobacterium branderi]ORA32389.1 GNAT family N-acetyltransferase [Mycobacterium branderi]BBZ11250.1 GCN5-like N-acetyltransferase [Mycobacterium branderi]
MTIQTRPARKADIPALAATLGRAFHDDPVATWIMPDDKRRAAHLHKFFATATRHHHLAGRGVEVACDGPEIGAAALWDPPNRWKQSAWEQLVMAPSLIRGFGLRPAVARKFAQLLSLMKLHHPEEPHWYLATIGSDTAVRGRGFGQALMRSRLDRCDAEHCPAYLESSKPENVPYYERFGFTVTGEMVLPDGGPTLWPMWRAPR